MLILQLTNSAGVAVDQCFLQKWPVCVLKIAGEYLVLFHGVAVGMLTRAAGREPVCVFFSSAWNEERVWIQITGLACSGLATGECTRSVYFAVSFSLIFFLLPFSES